MLPPEVCSWKPGGTSPPLGQKLEWVGLWDPWAPVRGPASNTSISQQGRPRALHGMAGRSVRAAGGAGSQEPDVQRSTGGPTVGPRAQDQATWAGLLHGCHPTGHTGRASWGLGGRSSLRLVKTLLESTLPTLGWARMFAEMDPALVPAALQMQGRGGPRLARACGGLGPRHLSARSHSAPSWAQVLLELAGATRSLDSAL